MTHADRQARAEATLIGQPVYRGHLIPPAKRDDAVASAEYAAAFAAYLNGAAPSAALGVTLADTGGYLAPPAFVAELLTGIERAVHFRRLARVLPPTSARRVCYPRRAEVVTDFQWAEELPAVPPPFQPRFGQMCMTPHYLTGELEASNDLLLLGRAAGAAGGGFVNRLLMAEIEYHLGRAEERAFIRGAGPGPGQPTGVFLDTEVGSVSGPLSDPLTWAKALYALPSGHLESASLRWVVHPSLALALAGLEDAAGAPLGLFTRGTDGVPRILGVPVALSDFAPTGTGANGAFQAGDPAAVVGDLAMYDIQDGADLSIYTGATASQARRNVTGFIVRRKVDGAVRVHEAFRKLIAA